MADVLMAPRSLVAETIHMELAGLYSDAAKRDFERTYGEVFWALSDEYLLRLAADIRGYVAARRRAAREA